MVAAPFIGPKLKLGRGQRHIGCAVEALKKFGADHPAKIIPKVYPEGHPRGRLQFEFLTPKEPVPDDIALLVGDAIHNIRAALDLMMCDIARHRKKSTDKVKFPFTESSAKLDDFLNEHIKRLGDDVVKLIKVYEPYKNGNTALYGLHKLDIADKHDIVLPISREGLWQLSTFDILFAGRRIIIKNGKVIDEPASVLLRDPNHLFRIESSAPENYNEICVVFAPLLPFAGEPVLKTLKDLANLVSGIVEAFETLCLGKKPNS